MLQGSHNVHNGWSRRRFSRKGDEGGAEERYPGWEVFEEFEGFWHLDHDEIGPIGQYQLDINLIHILLVDNGAVM